MRMIRDVFDGLASYSRAMEHIRRYRLWSYVVISGAISLALGLLIFVLAYTFSDNLGDVLFGWYKWDFGRGFVEAMSAWIGGALIVLLALLVYKYLMLIVLAPLMSPLSEKVESQISADYRAVPFSAVRMSKEMIRGMRLALRNFTREIGYTIVLLLLNFIPPLGLISTPAIFLVQAYYAGFGNMDYYLERHANIRQAARFSRRYKGLAIGNGAVFLFLLMIPVLGLILAPTWATVAATMEAHDRMRISE